MRIVCAGSRQTRSPSPPPLTAAQSASRPRQAAAKTTPPSKRSTNSVGRPSLGTGPSLLVGPRGRTSPRRPWRCTSKCSWAAKARVATSNFADPIRKVAKAPVLSVQPTELRHRTPPRCPPAQRRWLRRRRRCRLRRRHAQWASATPEVASRLALWLPLPCDDAKAASPLALWVCGGPPRPCNDGSTSSSLIPSGVRM